ncbi:unnamed protein product [Discula destructiva]
MPSSDVSGVTESVGNLSIIITSHPEEVEELSEEQPTPRQTHPLSNITQEHTLSERDSEAINADSETETERVTNMPSGSSSKHHSSSSSSKKHHSSSSSSKHQAQGDNWSEVTEPEERRRIQNRIAQRKFREKAREQKELQEREARNQELAGASYSVPLASDLSEEDQLSGLPWGGLNIPHMVQRGHNSASSRRGVSEQYDAQGHQQYYDPQLSGYGSLDMGYGGYGVVDGGDDRGRQQPDGVGDKALEKKRGSGDGTV